jgi:hypothetical protein
MASYSECNSFAEIKDKNICYAKIDLYNHLNNNPSLEKFLKDGAYLPPTGITDLDTVIENESSTTFQCTSTALDTAISQVTAVVNKSSLFNATGEVVSDPYAAALALGARVPAADYTDSTKNEYSFYLVERAIQDALPDTHFIAVVRASAGIPETSVPVIAANGTVTFTSTSVTRERIADGFISARQNAAIANARIAIAQKDALIANIYSQWLVIQKRRPNTDFIEFTAPGVSTITQAITNALTASNISAATLSVATTNALGAARRAAAITAAANEVCLPTVESTISVPKRMHIPTNTITRLNLPRNNYTTQGKIISFEIVKEYSDAESDKIFRAIQRSECNSNSCRAGKGSDIVFDKHGNIMLKWMAPSGLFETEIIKNNNLSEDLKNEIDSKDFSTSLDNETDAKEYIDEGIWDVSSKYFMNHAGTYIIYTPFKKSLIKNHRDGFGTGATATKSAAQRGTDAANRINGPAPTGIPLAQYITDNKNPSNFTLSMAKAYAKYRAETAPPSGLKYYLLYNPIHSLEFQIVYRLLTEINNPNVGSSTTSGTTTTTVTTTGTGPTITDRTVFADKDRGYMESAISDITKLPLDSSTLTTRYTMNIPSYINIISRYCNAFKIKGHPLPNRKDSEIFLDPVCSVAMNPQMAELSFILGQNYTQECLSYDYWALESAPSDPPVSEDAAKTRSLKGQADLKAISPGWAQSTITNSTPRWACKTHVTNPGDTALSWLEKVSKNFTEGSTSFINVLARSYAQKDGSVFLTPGNTSAINYIPSRLIIEPPKCNNLQGQDLVICNSKIEFNGDAEVSNSELNFVNACNGHGTDTPAAGGHPKIFAFAVSLPEDEQLTNSVAATLLPIFEGGRATIEANPPLTNERDVAAISNSIISGNIIKIRTISQRTTFVLRVTGDREGTPNNETSEQLIVPQINNTLPPEPTNPLGVSDAIFWPVVIVIIIIILAIVFLIV